MASSKTQLWRRVYGRWTDNLEKEGVAPIDLFQVCKVHDRDYPERDCQYHWSSAEAVKSTHARAQELFDRSPGILGPYSDLVSGQKVARGTLQWMWEHRRDSEALSACIILALIENYWRKPSVGCCGVPYFDGDLLSRIEEAAQRKPLVLIDWHHRARQVMPASRRTGRVKGRDLVKDCYTISSIVDALAEEFIAVFHENRGMIFEFADQPDPHVRAVLEEKKRRQQEGMEQRRASKTASVSRSDIKINSRELKRLVWSKPTSEVAKDVGISDVALAKRCRKGGVAKPPRGFWAKVRAGKVPHPKGVPVAQEC